MWSHISRERAICWLHMSFWLYLFLLLQCPHRGVVPASSSAPVPTTIGTKFESWCMFQQQTKCSNTQTCEWNCNELQTLKASSICKRRCEWNCNELQTLKISSICCKRTRQVASGYGWAQWGFALWQESSIPGCGVCCGKITPTGATAAKIDRYPIPSSMLLCAFSSSLSAVVAGGCNCW